jgi:hypothetical protein
MSIVSSAAVQDMHDVVAAWLACDCLTMNVCKTKDRAAKAGRKLEGARKQPYTLDRS